MTSPVFTMEPAKINLERANYWSWNHTVQMYRKRIILSLKTT